MVQDCRLRAFPSIHLDIIMHIEYLSSLPKSIYTTIW